jgi:hypothetical protein
MYVCAVRYHAAIVRLSLQQCGRGSLLLLLHSIVNCI